MLHNNSNDDYDDDDDDDDDDNDNLKQITLNYRAPGWIKFYSLIKTGVHIKSYLIGHFLFQEVYSLWNLIQKNKTKITDQLHS